MSDPAWDYTFPPGYDFQGCLGAGPEDASSIVPYHGDYDTCNTNSPPFFITPTTIPQGDTPDLLFSDNQVGLPRAKVRVDLTFSHTVKCPQMLDPLARDLSG